MNGARPMWGLLAEFGDAETLVAAADLMRRQGYRRLDAYTPFHVDGLAEALGSTQTTMPLLTLIGAICGGVGAYVMMAYATIWSYPLNVGGRPLYSWPSYIPITFELAVLGAALMAFFGMLIANGLPRLHHPLFAVPRFEEASRQSFFLAVSSQDPKFLLPETRQLLDGLSAGHVFEVPA